jgi:hypothetical protein
MLQPYPPPHQLIQAEVLPPWISYKVGFSNNICTWCFATTLGVSLQPSASWCHSIRGRLPSGDVKKNGLLCQFWYFTAIVWPRVLFTTPPPPLLSANDCLFILNTFVVACTHRVHTELQFHFSGVHSIMMEKLAQPSKGGGGCICPLPTPFHYIYHHVQSCGVRSNWEGRYTPLISTLPPYVLCGCTFYQNIRYLCNWICTCTGVYR